MTTLSLIVLSRQTDLWVSEDSREPIKLCYLELGRPKHEVRQEWQLIRMLRRRAPSYCDVAPTGSLAGRGFGVGGQLRHRQVRGRGTSPPLWRKSTASRRH